MESTQQLPKNDTVGTCSSLRLNEETIRELQHMGPRDAFGFVMSLLAVADEKLTVAVADYGRRLNLDRMRELRPEGYVQCGIAEQNLVEVSSALANEGFTVFAPCYATFITARVLDQVRVNLGMMKSPVILVGVCGGCESGVTGPSHMALEDIADMRCIPNISVFTPADNIELAATLFELAAHPRPAYVRLTAGDCVPVRSTWRPYSAAAEWMYLGEQKGVAGPLEGLEVRLAACSTTSTEKDADVVLIGAGALVGRVIQAAKLLREQGVEAAVLHMGTVKPLDTATLHRLQKCRLVVSVEEHSIMGGLGGAVAETLIELPNPPQMLRLGMPDTYFEADYQSNLLNRAGLSPQAIAERVLKCLG